MTVRIISVVCKSDSYLHLAPYGDSCGVNVFILCLKPWRDRELCHVGDNFAPCAWRSGTSTAVAKRTNGSTQRYELGTIHQRTPSELWLMVEGQDRGGTLLALLHLPPISLRNACRRSLGYSSKELAAVRPERRFDDDSTRGYTTP